MKKLYICGCSNSTGFYFKNLDGSDIGFNKPFTKIIAEKLSMEPVMLAQPGASNYFIIKQIQHAIEKNAKFLLINLAQSMRFDWVEEGKQLENIPRYEDFNGIINSNSFRTIVMLKKYKDLSRYITLYMNEKIRKDQDELMLQGIFSILDKNNINYYAVNCSTNFFCNLPIVSISENMSWLDILEKFHETTDPNHLNQKGHNFVADSILSKIKWAVS